MRNAEQKRTSAEYMREYAKRGTHGPCTVEGCERPMYGRSGLCAMHYQRKRTTGEIGEASPRFMQGYSKGERFWAKVDKSGDCWDWTAGISQGGYGLFEVNGKGVGAHRVAYELAIGPIPEGLELDHLCRNRRCVNPAHLEAVTPYENMLRGESLQARNARKTHCIHGHPLEGDNLKPDKWGRRVCRECANEATRAYRERLRAKRQIVR